MKILPCLCVAAFLIPTFAALAEEPMLHVITRNLSADIKPGSFSAQPKETWRSGTKYLRVDEAEDTQEQIHGTIIVVEPDVWMWNHIGDTANHIVDKGPNFVVHADIGDERVSEDLMGLELGNEREFFRLHRPWAEPDETIDGVPVSVQKVHVGETTLTLYLKKATYVPYQLSVKGPKVSFQIRYELYETDVPFNADLFTLPKTVKITEAKQ